MDGNIKGNYLKLIRGAVSRGQNLLIGKFKMAAGDVISIMGRLWSTRTFQQELKGSW